MSSEHTSDDATNLHEDVSGGDVSLSLHATRGFVEDVHFTQVGRAVHVDQSGYVLMREVAEERDLAQDTLCERDLLQRTGDHLDRDGLPRDLVRGGARCEERGRA